MVVAHACLLVEFLLQPANVSVFVAGHYHAAVPQLCTHLRNLQRAGVHPSPAPALGGSMAVTRQTNLDGLPTRRVVEVLLFKVRLLRQELAGFVPEQTT